MKKLLLISTAIISIHATPAFADVRDNRIATLEAQMKVMMQEINALKSERATEKKVMAQENAALKQQIKELEEKNRNNNS